MRNFLKVTIFLLACVLCFACNRPRTIEHANLVLKQEACKFLGEGQYPIATKPGSEPDTCRLEDVTIQSKGVLGEDDFFGIRNIKAEGVREMSLRQEYVIWIETGNIRLSAKAFAR